MANQASMARRQRERKRMQKRREKQAERSERREAKKEAEKLAKEIAKDAGDDFAAAVKRGDPGSLESAGRMPKNVLEPAPNYLLFTMPVGDVSAPVDTPRGFWIVKRIK